MQDKKEKEVFFSQAFFPSCTNLNSNPLCSCMFLHGGEKKFRLSSSHTLLSHHFIGISSAEPKLLGVNVCEDLLI